MTDQDNSLKTARRQFAELQTRETDILSEGMKYQVDEIRKSLSKANATMAALDPEGKKSAAEMERELELAVKAANLRTARKTMQELETTTVAHEEDTAKHYIERIRRSLGFAGEPLTALDPEGKQSEAEIEGRLEAAYRRICLRKARRDFEDYEKKDTAGWATLIDHLVGRIRKNLANAGEPLSAADPTGASSDADIEARLAAATRRIKILDVQDKLAQGEKKDKYVGSLDDVNRPREEIMKVLAELGLGLEALDASGKSTAAQMEDRLARAELNLAACGAMRAAETLEKYATGESTAYAGAYLYNLKNLEAFIDRAGGIEQLPVSDADRKRVAQALVTGSYGAVEDEIKDFEKMKAPASLKEVDARCRRIALLFNRASDMFKARATEDSDPSCQLQQRVNAADERARQLYYDAGGRMPVMKRIKLGGKAPSGSSA